MKIFRFSWMPTAATERRWKRATPRATLERTLDGENRAVLASYLVNPERVEFFESHAAMFAEMERHNQEILVERQRREGLSLVDMTQSWVLDERHATLCINAYREGNIELGDGMARSAAEMIYGKAMQARTQTGKKVALDQAFSVIKTLRKKNRHNEVVVGWCDALGLALVEAREGLG